MDFSAQRKQVVLLYITTAVGILLGVLSSIINTRFLDPSAYGDVRYVQNIINFISTFLLLGYFLSGSRLLALSTYEQKSREIRGALCVILIVTSIALIICVAVCALIHIGKPSISHLFIIALPVCVSPLLSNYVTNTTQGDNHIIRLSISRIAPSLLYVLIAFWIYSSYGATSSLMTLLQLGISSIIFICLIITTRPSFKRFKETFKELSLENKQYGIQLYYGSLVMVATDYLAGISLGAFNSDNVNVGFYTLALTVTSPLAQLPGIIGTTFFKKFATMDRIPGRVLKITVYITIFSCVCFIIGIKPLVTFLYSEAYSMVGVYASWMAFAFCIHGIGDMLNRYLGSHGQGVSIRNSSVVCGVIKLFGYTLFVYLWDINGAVLTTIFSSIVYSLMISMYYLKFIKK